MPRSFLEGHRRLRAAMAAVEIAHEIGLGAVTVKGICQRAKMGRSGLYDVFDNVGDCLRFGFAEAFELVFAEVREVSQEDGPWLQQLNAGLDRFFAAVAERPLLAEFCLVHCFGAADSAEGHDFEAGVATIAALISDQPSLAEDYLARTIVSLAALKLRQGQAKTLPAHRKQMAALVANALGRTNPAIALQQTQPA